MSIDQLAETQKWKLSSAWTDVTTTDERALMSLDTFRSLADYSCTLPSGVYIGKRWRRGQPYEGTRTWLMGEYAEDTDPEQAHIIWRAIYIVFNAGTPDEYTAEATDIHIDAHKTARDLRSAS